MEMSSEISILNLVFESYTVLNFMHQVDFHTLKYTPKERNV